MSHASRSVNRLWKGSQKAILVAAVLAATPAISEAAIVTWTGTNSANWSDAGNWGGTALDANPTGNAITIGSNPANANPMNNDLTNPVFNSITILNQTAGSGFSSTGNAFTLASTSTGSVGLSRSGSTVTATYASAPGYVVGQTITIAGATNTALNGTFTITGVSANTITYTTSSSGTIASDTATTTIATLSNLNTTSTRPVTIHNNITISNNQTWGSTSSGGVTILAGNLSGAGNLALNASPSRNGTLPAFRFAGSNGAYTGTISVTSGDGGLLMSSPNSFTSGLINISSSNQNLWLTGGAHTYTFGLTNNANSAGTTTGARVALRSATDNNGNGLYLTGGDVNWDPGNGGNYTWSQQATSTITFNGSNDTTVRLWNFGSNTGNLVLSSTAAGGTFSIFGGEGNQSGNNPGRVNLKFALADDATGGRLFSSRVPLLILTRAAVNNGAAASNTEVRSGMMAVSNMNQILRGNLTVNGGILLLDNVAWSDVMAARPFTGTGSLLTLSSGGFAARSSPLNINSGATASTFDRNLSFGSTLRDASGLFYANAAVNLNVNTTLTGRTIWRFAHQGPGVSNSPNAVTHSIGGNISGTGSLYLGGDTRDGGTYTAEVVINGSLSHTGNPFAITEGIGFNPGSGGLNIATSLTSSDQSDILVRFGSSAALPTGNSGSLKYLAGLRRNGGDYNYGYLFTGSNESAATYELGNNLQIILGGPGASSPKYGAIGSAQGNATLSNAIVNAHSLEAVLTTSRNVNLGILVRDSVFTLGEAAKPVTFRATVSNNQADSGTTGAATALVSSTNDRTGLTTLVKRGEGTAVLGNVAYSRIDGTSNAANFVWQIGRGTGTNQGTSSYFDGAVRGLSNTDPSRGLSNSPFATAGTQIPLLLRGGVYEINNTSGNSATFTAALGSATTGGAVNFGAGGGGFAAFGNNVTVNLGGSNAPVAWNATNFVPNNDSLMFGSNTSNAKVTFDNPIDFTGGTREVRVIGSHAVLARALTNGGLNKTGAGILELTSSGNTYTGGTNVNAGTLLVNNTANSGTGTGAVNVLSGAVLGGSGSIGGTTTISGSLRPGNSIGTMTVNNDVTWNAGNNWVFELGTAAASQASANAGGSTQDQLNITGTNKNFIKGTGSNFTFDFAGTGAAGWYKLVDWTGTTNFVSGDFVATNLAAGITSATFTVDAADSALYLTLTSGGAAKFQFTNTSNVVVGVLSGSLTSAGTATKTIQNTGTLAGTASFNTVSGGILNLAVTPSPTGSVAVSGTTNATFSALNTTGYKVDTGVVSVSPADSSNFQVNYTVRVGEAVAATDVAFTNATVLSGETTGGSALSSRTSVDSVATVTQIDDNTLVTMKWRTKVNGFDITPMFSDVVDITTTDGLYVLRMYYTEGANGGLENILFLGKHQGSGNWAAAGNELAFAKQFNFDFDGDDNIFNSADLGRWGIDTGNNFVWAVVSGNGQFAVIPEPTSLGILGLGAAGLLLRRRKA